MHYSSVLIAVLLFFNAVATSAADLELNGELSQGGAIRGYLPEGSEIKLDGRDVPQTPEGYFVFGFGRDAKPEALLTWRSADGAPQEKTLIVRQREYPTQYVEGVPQKTVTPAESKLKRIRKETALVKKARETF